MGEVMDELLADSDELVVRIAESFLEYRNLMVEYMSHFGNRAAPRRASLDFNYGGGN